MRYDDGMKSCLPAPSERLAKVARQLAVRAVDAAIDAAPHRPAIGEQRWSMTLALPAARVLLGQDDEAVRADLTRSLQTLADAANQGSGPLPVLTDGLGHTRGVYWPFVLHLHALALAATAETNASDAELLQSAAAPLGLIEDGANHPPAGGEVAEVLWRSLVRAELSRLTGDAYACASALGTIHRIANEPGRAGALHALGLDDLLDAWTYRELTGLHALHAAAQGMGDLPLQARCGQVAAFHFDHTQPDYTTYQPWALACFAYDDSTILFAEQQLHDVATHLSVEGPGGALLPALLLAEAVMFMEGRFAGQGRVRRFAEDL